MKILIFAVVVGLVAGTAFADEPTAGAPRYIAGNWTYPAPQPLNDALKDYSGGQVVLDCAAAADGHLTQCDVLKDGTFPRPAGPLVAEVFVKYCHVDPASVDGGVKDGDRHKFTYKW